MKTAPKRKNGVYHDEGHRKCILRLFSCPSSRPVRAGRFAPPNFDRGLKTGISSDDRRSIKNDHLQCEKLENGPFCTLKCGPLKKNRQIFFAHLLGPSKLVVLDPELWSGTKNENFQRWLPSDPKMIVYHSKVLDKSPVRFSTTPLSSFGGLNKLLQRLLLEQNIPYPFDSDLTWKEHGFMK